MCTVNNLHPSEQTSPQTRDHQYVDVNGMTQIHVLVQEHDIDENGNKRWYWPNVAVCNGVITVGPDARYF